MKHFLFIICLLNAFNCWSQTYTIKRLGMEKGLSNNFVIDIAEDKNGYLWFATEEGLNKLEGTTFTTYYKTENNEQGITGNELNCLLDDPEENILWIGTQRAGLNAFDYKDDTFTIYRHDSNNPNSLATDDVTGIYPAKDGNLWITTYWKGIDYLDKKTGTFTHYNRTTVPQLPGNHIWTATEDGKGNLYIGHRYEGMSILSLKTKQVENFRHDENDPTSLPGNEVKCIYQDQSGDIWVGTDKGLALFNPGEKNFLNFGTPGSLLSYNIFDICQLNDKQLWIATEFGGIAIIDLSQRFFSSPEDLSYRHIREGNDEYSLSNSSVRSIFQDSNNNIWVGLWGGGVNFLNNNATLFNTYCYSQDMPGSNLNARIASAVCMDRHNRLWIGTDGGGINVLEDGRRTATYMVQNGSLSGNSIQTALCDSEGNLWFGLFRKGIMYFDSQKQSFCQLFPQELSTTDVRSFFEDRNGLMWISSSNGIYQIDRVSKKIVKHIDIPENLVRDVIKDTQGRIWVGTFGGGLFLYSHNLELIRTFDTYAGFPSNTVNDIYEDTRHNVWIATGDGLVCFPPNNLDYQKYQRTEGLDNTHIRAIIEDHAGNIWFSTNKGISCFKQEEKQFYNYNHKDNIPLASFTTGSVCKDNKGNLYFGSTNGLCYFAPEQVLSPKEAPKAFFMKITVLTPFPLAESNGQTYPLANCDHIELEHKQNSFKIAFSVPDYALEGQVEYAYMLKGLSDSWYISDMNNITFRDVPYGKYELMVKTRIRNQKWSDKTTTLSIDIEPPFWLSWIAKLVYVVIGLILSFILLKTYKRRLNLEYLYESEKWNHEQEQHLNDERLRFFTNSTHELRTPLTLIIGPLEDMMGSHTLTRKDRHRIAVIHQSAIRLLELVNQILEFRKTETQNKKLCVCRENIAALVYEIGLKYKELNKNSQIKIQIHTDAEEMILYFDKEAMTIILDNLISNALKYTEKGQITISAHWTDKQNVRYLELSVQDTGYGISPEALQHIFDRYYQEGSIHQASGTGIGLALVKNLVTLHEGSIEVHSKLNEGTTFVVRIVATNNYPSALHRDLTTEEKETAAPQALPVQESQETADSMRPVILIVEDNKDILDYMVDSFTDLYEVKTATNGKEGVEAAIEYIPDIIVSDIMMPVMDGTALCKVLKKDIRTSHIPIILLTAKDTLADKEEGYQSGADSYLTKPFSASLLHSRINNLLAQRRRLSERYITASNPVTPGKDMEEKHSILTDSLNKLDKEFLDKLTHVITENLSSTETIDIGFLSSHLCMSNSTLYRKVKALTGMSTNEFIRKIKMQLAEKLLLEGKYSISEIAFKVGINSSVYFRQCFKEEYGMLPSEYLKKVKSGRSE